MNRDTLSAILTRADGVSGSGDKYSVGAGHELTVYLGEHGLVTTLRDVVGLELGPSFVMVKLQEHEAVWYAPYEDVFALSSRVVKDRTGRRAGFG